MNIPFFKYGLFGDDVSLVVAFVIGIGFGFFLERAGFGNGRKLAAQFYFNDLTVFKVMFTAIITAMVGIYYLSVIGWMDLSLVYLNPTYIVPQTIGGLLLGFGFVIGGYCPGTSCVSAVTGKIDGMVYLIGIVVGIFIFGEIFPLVSNFYNSTSMGQITLSQLFNIPYGILVFAVVLMAIGGFAAAEWAEKKLGNKIVEP
ncbi:MAG: YeeE/YedE thiosulfate transporter family protein [Bacteroidota bacterium]|nr:YeeE/YedE thiosulfate transporter family protein [Bacteroidota bacterium]